jgi:hypothetical protein
MAGGLFGRPFVLNVKCIIFSLLCMALFLIRPNMNNKLVLYSALIAIFALSYVAMAWYDYYYDCRINPLKRSKISVTGLFKPPPHVPEKQDALPKKSGSIDERRQRILIYMFHIILIVPLLVYIVTFRTKINPVTYPLLGALAVFTVIYHGIKMVDISHNVISD